MGSQGVAGVECHVSEFGFHRLSSTNAADISGQM
jgi:hypothetical protein